MNMTTLSAICATLFLGGFNAPWPLNNTAIDGGWWGLLWFLLKVILFLFFFIWVRGTVPRYRYDQLMAIGWKTLLPLSIGWLVLLGIYQKARAMADPGTWLTDDATAIGLVLIYLAISALVLYCQRRPVDSMLKPAACLLYTSPSPRD